MDARSVLLMLMVLSAWSSDGYAQFFGGPRSIVQTANFRVYASNVQLANEVAKIAESSRKQLAIHWIGKELPNWPERCPLVVNDGPNKPASGETKYSLVPGGVANFTMMVSGTPERIIDSVLPHEITHTIIASHLAQLGKPIPRWADEGVCTTVEHQSERSKHDVMLVRYLREGRGIPFNTLFALEDYPPDMMPLYAQGYSLSCFLIAQGGPQRFVKFLERGMNTRDWPAATEEFYKYPKLSKLQSAWNKWVGDGGSLVDNYTAESLGLANATASNPASNIALVNSVAAAPTRGGSANMVSTTLSNTPAQVPLHASTPSGYPVANLVNKSMEPSTGSFYADQLRTHRQSGSPADMQPGGGAFEATRVAANRDQESKSQVLSLPAPAQTIGGSYIRR